MTTDLIINTRYNAGTNISDARDVKKSLRTFRIQSPALAFFTSPTFGSRGYFFEGEYDLYEVGRIIDTEAFVARAFTKKHTLVFRDGWEITSKNKRNLEYIKRRLAEIEYVSGVRFDKLIKEFAYNLIAFHNAYIVKVRRDTASSGSYRRLRGGREIAPVAAYFCLAPETMEQEVDSSGMPLRYRQYVDGKNYREFPLHNIIHGTLNKRSGYTMGTPPLEAVKDDILALRRIEESVETLIYKSIFPIIHVKVGTEKFPAKILPDGTSEVEAATELLHSIQDDGGLVTSERIDIKAIGAESLALRVENYLEYFKKRVYAGLGMSAIDFGDGDATGRATGEVLSSALKDSIVTYQTELANIITYEIFDELLLESGKYEHSFEISDKDRVFFNFTTVDQSEKIKLESHILNMAQSGLLTLEEAREAINRTPLSEEDLNELFLVQIEKAKTRARNEIEAEFGKLMPQQGTSNTNNTETKKTSGGNTKSKQSKQDGAANAAKSKVMPKNQYSDSMLIKDALSEYASNISDKELALSRIERVMLEHAILNLTDGLFSSLDTVPEELETIINNLLADIAEKLVHDNVTRSEISSIIHKSIDKLDRYVNNIILGHNNENET